VVDPALPAVTRGWMANAAFVVPPAAPARSKPSALVTEQEAPPAVALPFATPVVRILCESLVVNSETRIRCGGADPVSGNHIDAALLKFALRIGHKPEEFLPQEADSRTYFYSSSAGRMCTLVRKPTTVVQLVTGAADLLLPNCAAVLRGDGTSHPIAEDTRRELSTFVAQATAEGQTVVLVATLTMPTGATAQPFPARMPMDEDLTCVALLAVTCPCRADATAGVWRLRDLGVTVRLTSGDHLNATCQMAKQLGVYTPQADGIGLEGPKFRELCLKDRITMFGALPNLQVLACCDPSDRYNLVAALKESQSVVAVTGDALYDSGAMRLSNVAFALGRGCQVAKWSAGVIAMDDSLDAIATAVQWGRSFHGAVRRFVHFQLTTICMTALLTLLSVCCFPKAPWPLSGPQLLWLSLLVDGFATLAFALDHSADDGVMTPVPLHSRLVSVQTQKMIAVEVLFQGIMLSLLMSSAGASWLEVPSGSADHRSLVSNAFLLFQLVQLFACQAAGPKGPFLRLGTQNAFTLFAVAAAAFALQVIGTQMAPAHMGTTPLTFRQWGVLFLYSAGRIPVDWGFGAFLYAPRSYAPIRDPAIDSSPRWQRCLPLRWVLNTDRLPLLIPRTDWALSQTHAMAAT